MALGCTVAELLARISSAELSEWMAYDSIDPIGKDRGDMQAGIISMVVANSSGAKNEGRAFSPADFMPYVEKKKINPAVKFKAQMAHLLGDK